VITSEVTWVYDDFIGWLTGPDFGDPRAGRGIENPKAVLAAVRERVADAERASDGSIAVRVNDADINVVIREGRIAAVRCRSTTADLDVTSTVSVEAYDRDTRIIWKDIPEPPQ